MSEHSIEEPRAGAWASAWVTAVLSAAAAVAVIFGVFLAFGREDTEPLESALLLPVSQQLVRGPWELYGPYRGWNHLVLIHAPLYYHLAALLAWPLHRSGVDPVWAALAAGRSLSFLGLAATLAAACRLARLDGTHRRMGWWAALLIAASPVLGAMPYTVRPDMLGVALQTTGVLLVLSALRSEQPRGSTLPVAFAAFGLAACLKQHFIAAPLLSTVLLLTAWLRGRLSFKLVARGLLTGLAIVLFVYGAEELATGGRMSQAVFQAAASVSSVHPGTWTRAWIVTFGIMAKSIGLLGLLMAAGLAEVAARPGFGRRALVVAGTVLVGLIAVPSILDSFESDTNVWEIVLPFVNVLATVFFVIPACYLLSPRAFSAGRLDRDLWVYLAAEVGLVAILSRASTGAWVNYGIQAVVFASVLTARALARACAGALAPFASLPIALAALVLLIGVSAGTKLTAERLIGERLILGQIFDHYKRPSSEFFFVARPGDNRVYGRRDLVYDDWLYPVFESIHLAEPRSVWLRRALTSSAIHFIVNTSNSPNIDGLGETLPKLRYVRGVQVGPFYVWERSAFVSTSPHR